MKYKACMVLSCIFIYLHVNAQEATIREEKIQMKTYMFSDPDPVPDMEKNYPYFRFDGFTNHGTQTEWNMVILENNYVKVYIATEIGGKIWGAIEKSTGGEFLYFNDVVKFRDVAHRGPWTSGGLEYNFGIMSHVSTCATPQDYMLSTNEDGSVSCTIGALDLHTQTRWNVEVILPKDKAYVVTRASWFNTNKLPVSFYHYMNAAAKTKGNLEFIYPGSHHIGHGGEVGTWPVDKGRDISYYENNNFGPYKSYHVLNAYSDIFGGYWHDDDFGFGHWVDYTEMPGKKLWIWGLSQQGMIWEDLLTDSKGQYIEFQAGKSFNQAMTMSSLTPFKHSEFLPYDSDISTELWFPIKGTGGMVAASEYGVLNVEREGDGCEIVLSALQSLNADLVVRSEGIVIKQESLQMSPLEIHNVKVHLEKDSDYTVELGDNLLVYSSKREDLIVDRPVYPNEEYDYESAVGLFTRGIELERQQSYISGAPANQQAHELYKQSLGKDPAFAPALNRLAMSFFRRTEYETALQYVLKSLAIDTYDPEANYLYGLINDKFNKSANAKSGFSIASQSLQYRVAALTELARLYLKDKRYDLSARYAQKAMAYNKYNVTALQVLALIYKIQNKNEELSELLDQLYQLDKTSAFVKFMRTKEGQGNMAELNRLITNELPHETYLELAIGLYNCGFPEASIQILKASPAQPVVYLWLAYLEADHQGKWLESAISMSTDFAFPYREETLEIVEHFMGIREDWQLKYYAALIYWKKGRLGKAKELFVACGENPTNAAFYLAKAKLFEGNGTVQKDALAKAESIDKENWRVQLALIEQRLADGEFDLAAESALKSLKKYPEYSVLGINYAIALLNLGEYKKCVSFLESFQVIPFEGAVMGRNAYHEACIMAALEEVRGRKYQKAIGYAEKARLWPVNLGSGKPYDTDERLENYVIAYCHERLGNNLEARGYYDRVIDHVRAEEVRETALLYLQVLALRKNNRDKEAVQLFEKSKTADPDNKNLIWVDQVDKEGLKDIDSNDFIESEDSNSPVNNEFKMLKELLSVTNSH